MQNRSRIPVQSTAVWILTLVCLCLVFSPLNAADRKLAPIDELIQQGHAAHEACLSGHNRRVAQAEQWGQSAQRGGSPLQERYDVTYYDLHMKFDRPDSSITGDVALTAKVVASLNVCEIDCYFMMQVDSVLVNGINAPFSRTWDMVIADLGRTYLPGEQFTVRTFYHGREADFQWWALHFVDYGGEPIVGNLSEPYYARSWWPCKDYPNDKADSLDFKITYPSQYFCSSNGVMISDIDHGDGFRTTHWSERYPIATYLVSIAMAEFTHWREWALITETDSLPIDYWVYPSLVPTAQNGYWITPLAMDTLSRLYGEYPFKNEKYAMSNFMWGGAMEHQTNTSMSPGMSGNPITVIHELAHQWWGDMITCRDWHHIWLNEGFATYSEALMLETVLGETDFHAYMAGIEYYSNGSVYVYDTTSAGNILDLIVYHKGGWVLHMLRGIIGDEAFFSGLLDYGNSPLKYGTAVTEDFQYYMEQASGQDLDWFFSEWIYGHGNPNYEYRWQCVPSEGGYRLDLIVMQIQTGIGFFAMPLQFEFETATRAVILDTIWNEQPFTLYQLEFADSVTSVTLDPMNWVLESHIERPFGLTIASRHLPEGEVGLPYQMQLEALGGTPPYDWTFLGGDLPFGLNFAGGDQAMIEGVPTYPATYYFSIEVADAALPPSTDVYSFTITINPAVMIGDLNHDATVSLPDAVYLVNYIFAGGPSPDPMKAGDTDCNGYVNVSDVVFVIRYIFGQGPAPCK